MSQYNQHGMLTQDDEVEASGSTDLYLKQGGRPKKESFLPELQGKTL